MCTARYRECRPASISSRSKFHFGVVILDATLDPPRDWTPPPPRHRASCTPFPSRPGKKDARLNVERSNITISNSVSVLRALLYMYISRFRSDGGKFDRYRKRAEKQRADQHAGIRALVYV